MRCRGAHQGTPLMRVRAHLIGNRGARASEPLPRVAARLYALSLAHVLLRLHERLDTVLVVGWPA